MLTLASTERRIQHISVGPILFQVVVHNLGSKHDLQKYVIHGCTYTYPMCINFD